MHTLFQFLVPCLAWLLLNIPAFGQTAVKVSQVIVPAEECLPGWTETIGLVIDDLATYQLPADAPEMARESIALLRKMAPAEVLGMADIDYTSDPQVTKMVTVNLIQYKDAASARVYWDKKLVELGKEGKAVEESKYPSFEYVGAPLNKRFVLCGPYWVSASQLMKGDEYLTALKVYVEKLESLKAF